MRPPDPMLALLGFVLVAVAAAASLVLAARAADGGDPVDLRVLRSTGCQHDHP